MNLPQIKSCMENNFFSSLTCLAASVICSSTLVSLNEVKIEQIHESFSVQNQYIQQRSYLSYCDSSSILPPTISCLTTQRSCQTFVHLLSAFSISPFSVFKTIVKVYISMMTESLPCYSKQQEFVFAKSFPVFGTVFAVPLSIGQIMKIFDGFTENYPQHLCNVI